MTIDLEQARRRAKERLRDERRTSPQAKLTAAQHVVARDLGYASWPALVRDTERFSVVEDPEAVTWERVTRISVVCLVEDPDAPGGADLVLHERDGRWVVPTGVRLAGEDVWDDAVLRIPMETMGFRRQDTHPFALDHGRRHVVFWVTGGRYRGTRMTPAQVPWWTGSVADGIASLRSQGDGALASLVEAADESRRTMSYERRAADVHRTLVGAYLSASTVQGASGFGGTVEEWRDARGVLVDALDPSRSPPLIQHQLDHVVAPGGRVVLSEYGDPPSARSAEALVTRAGFTVAGRTRQPTRSGRERGFPSVWIEAPPAG